MTNLFESVPTVQEVMKSVMDHIQRRAENGTVAQENGAADAQIQSALDALGRLEKTLYSFWDRPERPEVFGLPPIDFETIRAALQSPRVPVIEGLDDAIASCVRYPKTNEIGFLTPADRDNVLKAARAYAELQKGV